MGVPGLPCFISKWNLAKAALDSTHFLAPIGLFALMISALLTAIYMMSIAFRAFCPGRDFDDSAIQCYRDPGWMMLVPLAVFTVLLFVFGLHSEPLVELFTGIASNV
jgi:multicomponent Na+:H+ antiporter subunit D